ncbi:MAG: hypothetical protein ACYDB7_03860 [Mycobacteriales bacterium]
MTWDPWGEEGSGDPSVGPADPAAVEADASLLDALAAGGLPEGAEPVAGLLAALRAEMEQRPREAPVVHSSTRFEQRRRANPRWRARTVLLAAGAASAVAVGGIAAAAVVSPPGSLLYPLHEFLTGTPNPSDAQAVTIRALLSAATTALRQGRLSAAATDLARARALLPRVGSKGEEARLSSEVAQLTTQVAVAQQSHNPTSPGITGGTDGPVTAPTAGPSATPSPTPSPSSTVPAAAGTTAGSRAPGRPSAPRPHASPTPGNPHSSGAPSGNPHSSGAPSGNPHSSGGPSGNPHSRSPHGHAR